MLSARTFLIGATLALAACAQQAEAAVVQVYKNATCGCCTAWVEHLRTSGFDVRVTNLHDVTPVARRLGVPDDLRSCHTAEVGGYFVEGHVPAADVKKLLTERPAAAGVTVPGVPMGSPGMDQGGAKEDYATLLVDRKGKSRLFVRHPATE